jgi:2-polyprenyl-3-methyl-5-hydroxy-6-metoxy-1,4-benzoquinol methylase
MEEKTIHCPICNTSTSARAFLQTYISPYNKQEYKMYECLNCQVQWWEPLKMIPEFYESEVFEAYISYHEGVRKLPSWCKPFFKYFPKNKKGKLLDVGCGDGIFLNHAKEQGFEVWGIDFDKKSIEAIKRNFHIETVFPMSLEEFCEYAKSKNLNFDVITFFEVLEHQDNPRKFLDIVKSLLNEKGWIVGSVPNRERLFAEIDWKYFHGDYPPHHFLRFSKSALEKIFKLNNFSHIEIYCLDLSLWDIIPYIEKRLFGNLDILKVKLKTKITKDERKARAFKVEDLENLKKSGVRLLKVLKFIRNLILFPFALPYIRKLRGNGPNLYFQVQK